MATRETVESMYRELAAGNIPALLELLDENVEWREADGFVYRGTYRSPAAVIEGVFARIGSEWTGFKADIDRLVVEDEHAMCIGTYSGTYGATGKSFSARFAHALEVRGGKVVRFEQVVDSAEVDKALS